MADLIIHGAKNHQKDNVASPQGGPIDHATKIMTDGITSSAAVQIIGSDVADITQTYLVKGIGGTRAIESEVIQLNGIGSIGTIKRFSRLCGVYKQSGDSLSGNITICSGPNILGIMDTAANSNVGVETKNLINLLANAKGRATVPSAFYEKIFIRNNTGSVINKLVITEHQSDFNERVLFAADQSLDFNSTSPNRLTKPGSLISGDFTNDDPITVNNILNGHSVGIWLRVLIPRGEGTVLSSWKTKFDYDGKINILTLLHPEGHARLLEETLTRRVSHPIGGGNPLRFVELSKAKFVEQLFYEPDPRTFRDQFYYNARQNKLFKKLNTKPIPVWKLIR